jgi:hypothetical protein
MREAGEVLAQLSSLGSAKHLTLESCLEVGRQVLGRAQGKQRLGDNGGENEKGGRRTKPTGTPTFGLPPVPSCVAALRVSMVNLGSLAMARHSVPL